MWCLINGQRITSHGAFVLYLHVLRRLSVGIVIILYIFWMHFIVLFLVIMFLYIFSHVGIRFACLYVA